MAMQRRESLTNQILSCARTTGRSQSLPFLVEDAQVLYRKLSTVAIDRGLETVAPATKMSSSMCVRVCVLIASFQSLVVICCQACNEVNFVHARMCVCVCTMKQHCLPSPFSCSPPSLLFSLPPSLPPSSSSSLPPPLLSPDQEKQPALQTGRPSVADFVDELTEVEQKVSGKTSPKSPKGGSGSQRSNITASTATIELDELMANLSKFEPSSSEATYSKPNKGVQKQKSAVDDLNSMLGSLQQDMTQRHGVDTAAKGLCAACSKPILAKMVNALGKQWHPEHFTCTSCDVELGQSTYYESNGRPYCEKDYHELYAPRCAYCNGPILDVS